MKNVAFVADLTNNNLGGLFDPSSLYRSLCIYLFLLIFSLMYRHMPITLITCFYMYFIKCFYHFDLLKKMFLYVFYTPTLLKYSI